MKKLSAKGFGHHILIMGLVVVAVIGGIGSYIYLRSSSADTTYPCGSSYTKRGQKYANNAYYQIWINKGTKSACAALVKPVGSSGWGKSQYMSVGFKSEMYKKDAGSFKYYASTAGTKAMRYTNATANDGITFNIVGTYKGVTKTVQLFVSEANVGYNQPTATPTPTLTPQQKCTNAGGKWVDLRSKDYVNHGPCWDNKGSYLVNYGSGQIGNGYDWLNNNDGKDRKSSYPNYVIVVSGKAKVCWHGLCRTVSSTTNLCNLNYVASHGDIYVTKYCGKSDVTVQAL